MHRFRKKSDVKRSPVPDFQSASEGSERGSLAGLSAFVPGRPSRGPPQALHEPSELPPASDFRTSLILPDLTRRFTLLRTSSGDPVSLTDLRTRFAEQRARGAENQISEEEEDMILETLNRIRSKNTVGKKRSELEVEDEGDGSGSGLGDTVSGYQASPSQQSTRSSNTTFGSPSTPSSRSAKRYSNNLFGSGRSRDFTVARSLTTRTSRSTASSITGTEGSSTFSDRPITPDSSGATSSAQSTPEKASLVRSASLAVPGPYGDQSNLTFTTEYRLPKTLGPSGLKRASLAFEDAIKAMALIEEEAEEEILMPRTPFNRAPSRSPNNTPELSPKPAFGQPSTAIEAGTAILPGVTESERRSPIPMGRPGTVSPTPRLPGYIPGMPRPMTPRDTSFDSDDQLSRANSITPRAAASPAVVVPLRLSPGSRNESNSTTTARPRPTSPGSSTPLFLPRSVNGRFTPTDDYQRNGSGTGFSTELDSSTSSSILGTRRRPASPLSPLHYQPMAVSSRPGTPSNVTWNPQPSSPTKSHESHSRNGSWTSGNHDIHDALSSLEGTRSTTRSLRSPALPDSPMIFDMGQGDSNGQIAHDSRPSSALSRGDLGSPVSFQNRIVRSPTPTQNAPRSPASPTFTNYDVTSSGMNGSRRSSNQNPYPFSLGPTQPLVFSPMANSSRSSLESAGSSYHSWDAGLQKDRGIELLINDIDPQQPAWHDVGGIDKSSDDDEFDEEEIIGRYAGLTKFDFVAIQEKLVGAAIAKSTPAPRDRVPSLRRRRPSTSQSNYSLNGFDSRVSSPPPQTQIQGSPETRSPHSDNTSKASALLDLVVSGIPPPRNQSQNPTILEDQASDPSTDVEYSNSSRRNRDLAAALFGELGQDHKDSPPKDPPTDIPTTTVNEPVEPAADAIPQHDTSGSSSGTEDANSASPSPPYVRSPGAANTPPDQAELAREVKRKTEAAMAQLRRAPSQSEAQNAGSARKRVSPNQISSPRLVAATTSVDTIPLRSPSSASGQQTSKITSGIGQGLRRLRGTLRSKPTAPSGNEVTPYPLDLQSPPPVQIARYNHDKLHPGGPGAMSATELGGFKTATLPNQPASAGPTLKGFMARFRKPRATELSSEFDRRTHLQNHSVTTSSSSSPHGTSTPEQVHSAPATHDSFDLHSSERPHPAAPTLPKSDPPVAEPHSWNQSATETNDADQRRILFKAASNLGLDPKALNDLLSRSATLTRNNSVMTPSRSQPLSSTSAGLDRSKSLTTSSSQSVPSSVTPRSTENVGRKSSFRKRGDQARVAREGAATASVVVRRTIIFPSEQSSTIDLNVLMGKSSSSRQRGSGSFHSSRSVHDRAPTPPPPRSPTSKRFSQDSPPVPQLPSSMSTQAENMLHVPQSTSTTGQIEKSSSTYDSLYEMYAGERKSVTSVPGDTNRPNTSMSSQSVNQDNMTPSDSGPAIELVEYANGESIWSIVNGLRDDDMDSVFPNRASFASNYSSQDGNEPVQVRFRQHGRSGSTGSTSSFALSSKKLQPGSVRPETKVFYSSSAQIGRLIENLSHNMEAGSFKFTPSAPQADHSSPSSFHSSTENWTVEETLEHMLGSIGSS